MTQRIVCSFLVLFVGLSSGCSMFGGKDDDRPTAQKETNTPAQTLYDQGKEYRIKANYTRAIEYFEALESRYPFGPYAQHAKLEIAYCLYRRTDNAASAEAIDQFLRLYPRHPNTDYAYYLKGLAKFHELDSSLDRILRRNMAAMDPDPIHVSFNQFKNLLERFPESKFAPDARQRMVYLRNLLAQHELQVADFYRDRGAWAAVAKRASYVVETYENSTSTGKALALLAEAYGKLGLDKSQAETLEVLRLNFPNQKI